jgi:membrane dipeptidase
VKRSAYKGYRSFSYLEPGADYRVYDLAAEIDRVAPHVVEVSAEQEERVDRLLDENISISLHDHGEVDPVDPSETDEWIREGRIATGYEGLWKSRLTAVFENFEDGVSTFTSKNGWKWNDVIHDLGMRYCDWDHQDFVIRARGLDDIHHAFETGRIAVFSSLESATPIENELDRIDVLYGIGVRMLGIAYSEGNALGAGCREDRDAGLTHFGRRAVERMNKLGMVIDVSHSGDVTSLETIAASTKPVCISHSGARELWPISKCKSDEVIKACAERGGVIGIEAAPGTTMTTDRMDVHDLNDVMRHFEHCVDLAGIDAVTFGPDTFFGDHSASYQLGSGSLLVSGDSEYDRVWVPYVVGLENIGDFPNIVRWLVKHDYSDDEIAKVIGGNTMRVLEANWSS